MSEQGYEVYVVIRDKDYPMSEGGTYEDSQQEPQPWEAGWFLAVDFADNDDDAYELRVLPFAEELTRRAADIRTWKMTEGGEK